MKHYTEEHEWVEDKSGIFRIGITQYAQEQLGDVVSVDLPTVGQQVGKGESCAAVESVKAASDIYAPTGGEITAVNESLADAPELINQSPESEGWLWEMKGDAADLEGLMDESAYMKFVEEGN